MAGVAGGCLFFGAGYFVGHYLHYAFGGIDIKGAADITALTCGSAASVIGAPLVAIFHLRRRTTDPPTEHNSDARAATRKGQLKFRYKALAVVSCALCLIASVQWMSSYNVEMHFQGRLWGDHVFLTVTREGRLISGLFTWDGDQEEWPWDVINFTRNGFTPPYDSEVMQTSWLGFAAFSDPTYEVTRSVWEKRPDSLAKVTGTVPVTLSGGGVVIPFWFITLMTAIAPCIIFFLRRNGDIANKLQNN